MTWSASPNRPSTGHSTWAMMSSNDLGKRSLTFHSLSDAARTTPARRVGLSANRFTMELVIISDGDISYNAAERQAAKEIAATQRLKPKAAAPSLRPSDKKDGARRDALLRGSLRRKARARTGISATGMKRYGPAYWPVSDGFVI